MDIKRKEPLLMQGFFLGWGRNTKSSRQRLVYHPPLEAVYHQLEELYIIKPQERCTLARDDIQTAFPFGDMHRTSRGDDMPSLRLG